MAKKNLAQKKYERIIKQEKKKLNKSRKQYGKILAMPDFFDYLVGEEIRVIPGPNPDYIYGVIQKKGYERLSLPFLPEELELYEKNKARKSVKKSS